IESPADVEPASAAAAAERQAGLALEWLEGQALRSLGPAISAHVVGGLFCPAGGQANPLLVAPSFGKRAQDHGAVVWEGCPVSALGRDGAGFSLETRNGRVRAGRVVLAAGAWTPGLATSLDVRLPITLFVPQMTVTV